MKIRVNTNKPNQIGATDCPGGMRGAYGSHLGLLHCLLQVERLYGFQKKIVITYPDDSYNLKET